MPTRKGKISLCNIKINDSLFSHYVELISSEVLPYQWEVLNDRIPVRTKSHCLENFRIAAGRSKGKFYGAIFQDSDVYKWLEAVSYTIAGGHRDRFLPLAEEAIDCIGAAQQEDGYLNTYFTIAEPEKRWTNLLEGHELYCAGHLFEAAAAYYEATGNETLLEISYRFADLICRTFGRGDGQLRGYPGHQVVELGLVKLYRISGKKTYLDTARYFLEERGARPNYFTAEIEGRGGEMIFPEFRNYDLKYSQAHIPPAEQTTAEGHAVRAAYMYSAMADIAGEEGDGPFGRACRAIWENLAEKRMYITGGIGSSGHLERFTTDYDLPNDRNYCETCASVGLMMFSSRMTALTGDARYYDGVERALYNTVLAGIHRDGKRYFYVNPLEVWPENCLPATSLNHVKPERQEWFDVACCPTNIARTLASLGRYIYSLEGDRLCVNLFISSDIGLEESLGYSLAMDGDITGSGTVRLTVSGPAGLNVRIPAYGKEFTPIFNGKDIAYAREKGYARFDLEEAGELRLDFSIAPRWIAANGAVRENAGKMALSLGPFIYCLEEEDNGNRLAEIAVSPGTKAEPVPSPPILPGRVPFLRYRGSRLQNRTEGLYGPAEWSAVPVEVTALPYALWCNRKPGEMLVWQKVRID